MQILFLVIRDKGNRIAEGLGTPCPADTMHIIFGKRRHIKIDHMRNPIHIDAARRNIRCHHHLKLILLKTVQRFLTLALRTPRVNRHRLDPRPIQMLINLVGPVPRSREHQHTVHVFVLQQVPQQIHLLVLAHRVNVLRNRLNRIMLLADLNHLGILLNPRRQSLNLLGHGR